jgi:hypothetical protein
VTTRGSLKRSKSRSEGAVDAIGDRGRGFNDEDEGVAAHRIARV